MTDHSRQQVTDTADAQKAKHNPRFPLWAYELGVVLIWTLLVALTLIWNLKSERASTLEAARIEARTAIEKDIIYRRWNSESLGIYAPISARTPPNPFLWIKDRDITTTDGLKLTRINPAYMTRQAHQLGMSTGSGIKGHLTSLKPIRPANRPDAWGKNALTQFHTGALEASALVTMDGGDYMRLMRPLTTEKSCLKCHAVQGYRLGQIRGGLSAAVPMAPLLALEKTNVTEFTLLAFLVWAAGLIGNRMGMRSLNRQLRQRLAAEEKLRQTEKLKGVIEIAGSVCHELGQPMQAIYGYSEIIKLKMDTNDPLYPKIEQIVRQIDRMKKTTRKLMNITRYETKKYLDEKIIDIDRASK